MDLAKTVKRLREAAGWTQEQLARKAGVSQQLIAKIERGKVHESRKLPRIAAVFNLKVEELVTVRPSELRVASEDTVPYTAIDEGELDTIWSSFSPQQKQKILEIVRLAGVINITIPPPSRSEKTRTDLKPSEIAADLRRSRRQQLRKGAAPGGKRGES